MISFIDMSCGFPMMHYSTNRYILSEYLHKMNDEIDKTYLLTLLYEMWLEILHISRHFYNLSILTAQLKVNENHFHP